MFAESFPDVPQVACFDTEFHADVPEEEYLFALPKSLSQESVRRYGFHGFSYQYVVEALQSCRAGATRATYSMCLVLTDRYTARVVPAIHDWTNVRLALKANTS